MKISKILFPTDFSIYSEKALQDTVEYARQHNAELIILHVIEIHHAYDAYGNNLAPILYYEKIDEIREVVQKRLANLIETYKEYPAIRFRINEGNPFEEILQTEIEEDVDLIVMGSHGHTFSIFALLGSVTEKVVRKSNRSVFVLKYPKLKKNSES